MFLCNGLYAILEDLLSNKFSPHRVVQVCGMAPNISYALSLGASFYDTMVNKLFLADSWLQSTEFVPHVGIIIL